MSSSRPAAQRHTRGYRSLVWAAAGLAAVTGIALWYFSGNSLLDRLWRGSRNRPTTRKKRSVVVVVDEYISKKLPAFEESREYAEMYIISGPGCAAPENELHQKVEHPTRLLHCETNEGIIHITKHIKPDVVVTAQPIPELQGWVGKSIIVSPKSTEGSGFGLVCTAWLDGRTFEDLLFGEDEGSPSY